jgi:signal transduction histidine kinase
MKRTDFPIQSQWIRWSVIAGAWVLIGILFSSQFYLSLLAEAETLKVSWEKLLPVEFSRWGLWIFLTPVVLWMARRFPIEQQRWWETLMVHFPACVAVAALHIGLYSLIVATVKPFPWTVDYAYAQVFLRGLSSFLHVNLVIYWTVIGAGYALNYYRKYREEEIRASSLQAQLAEAQLQALKMQLHPHFLFNTLNAVATLVRKNENKSATDMLAGLSELLRLALENVGTQEVTLKQEMEFLERYLEIEQIRFGEKLKVRMTIRPETLSARVPNLVLQPLVENAIRHGMAQRESPGLVEISAEQSASRLRMQVRDDGPGLTKEINSNTGVGLANVRARLERLYGGEQEFKIENANGGGTVVTLIMPFNKILE